MSGGIGATGEQVCAAYYKENGFQVVAANYRSRFGEVDLIVENAETLVFVEVKTRKPGSMVSGLESVTPSKQQKLRKTAELYLQAHPVDKQLRFDVVEMLHASGTYRVHRHVVNAF